MGIEEVKKVMLKEKENSLRMSRVPSRIRENFINLAEQEFAGDYGMAFKYLWDKYEEYIYLYQNIDTKLDHIIMMAKSQNTEESDRKIRLLSGRVLKGGEEK